MFMAKEHFVGPREHKLDREFQICFAEKETTNLPTKKLQPFKAKNTGKGTMEDTYFHILQRFKMGSVFFSQWNTHDSL